MRNMDIFDKMNFERDFKCRHCGQVAPVKSENWEILGKHKGDVIMVCLKCGHGLKMGFFVEKYVSKKFVDKMRAARERDLRKYEEQIKGKCIDPRTKKLIVPMTTQEYQEYEEQIKGKFDDQPKE